VLILVYEMLDWFLEVTFVGNFFL